MKDNQQQLLSLYNEIKGQMDMLHSTLYLSKAKQYFSEGDIDLLISKSKENNHNLGISGFLVFQNGYFAQYIEGSKASIEELTTKLKADKRHEIVVWLENTVDKPKFKAWDMKQLKNAMYQNLDMASFIMEELSMTRHHIHVDKNYIVDMWENIALIARYYQFVEEQKQIARLIS